MNLRDLAAADHRSIVEDVVGGFGRELTFVDPKNNTSKVSGFWNDIGQRLDPGSGAIVEGRVGFVRVTLGALRAAGLGIPESVEDDKRKPWTVAFADFSGREPQRYKIVEVRVDRAIDAVDCYLASYR